MSRYATKFALLDASWSPECNVIHLRCECGYEFEHPIKYWVVVCKQCGFFVHIDKVLNQPFHKDALDKVARHSDL